MARITDPDQLQQLIEKLVEKRVQASIELLRAEEGMEVEVMIAPTENLTTVAYSLAQTDLTLVYDGENVKVHTKPVNPLDEETVKG